jgi:hypothetical protein
MNHEVSDAEPFERQEVLPVRFAAGAERLERQLAGRCLGNSQLDDDRPPAEDGPAQTEEHPVAGDGEALDVEAVVLARDALDRSVRQDLSSGTLASVNRLPSSPILESRSRFSAAVLSFSAFVRFALCDPISQR